MIIYLIPIKYACYKVFIVSALDFKEIMENISHIFVHFSKPSYNYETFLSQGTKGFATLVICLLHF